MIAFLTEGNQTIGMGHYLRCSGIAESLIEKGEDVCFIIPADADAGFLGLKGFRTYPLGSEISGGWDIDEACSIINRTGIKTVVVDSYRIDNDAFERLKSECGVIYIDDLDMYDCSADIVINFNPGADESGYMEQGISGRSIYAGVKYYPLRTEFNGKRKEDLNRIIGKVLITSGSTDPFGCVKEILTGIDPSLYGSIEFDVLIGKYYQAQYKGMLEDLMDRYPNVKLLAWGDAVSDLIVNADLVIAPGASMIMEALSLNVPCISYEFVDNHHETCIWLEKLGMTGTFGKLPVNDTDNVIREVFISELDFEKRKEHSEKYSEVFDGKGLERVVKIIMDSEAARR